METITMQEYLRTIEQAVVQQSEDIAEARRAAKKIAAYARSKHWTSRFRKGGVEGHLQGKLAESAFWIHAETVGNVSPEGTPYSILYGPGTAGRCDFTFYRYESMGKYDGTRVEVKSGGVSLEDARCWDITRYGMPVNAAQAHDNNSLSDLLVYVIVDKTQLNDPVEQVVRCAVVGWCRWDRVLSQPLRKARTADEADCYIVPVAQMHPIDTLYSYLKTGSVSNTTKTENENCVKVIS